MKTLCTLLATLLLAGGGAAAQTNTTLTFTNLKGRVYQDVTVTRVMPDGLVFKTENGGGFAPFKEMPEPLRARYNFNPELAKQAEEKKKAAQTNTVVRIATATAAAKTAGQFRREKEEFLSSKTLIKGRVIGIEGKTLRVTSDMDNPEVRKAIFAPNGYTGPRIGWTNDFKLRDGAKICLGTCTIIGAEVTDQFNKGDKIEVWGFPVGEISNSGKRFSTIVPKDYGPLPPPRYGLITLDMIISTPPKR